MISSPKSRRKIVIFEITRATLDAYIKRFEHTHKRGNHFFGRISLREKERRSLREEEKCEGTLGVIVLGEGT